jgi:hypothetical protein
LRRPPCFFARLALQGASAGFPSLTVCWRQNAISNAKFYSRSDNAVIRVYDDTDNVIETHEHTGDFRECSAIVFGLLAKLIALLD